MRKNVLSLLIGFSLLICILLLTNLLNVGENDLTNNVAINTLTEVVNASQDCWGTGNPAAVCICYYETYCAYVLPTDRCANGTIPLCP